VVSRYPNLIIVAEA